MDPIVRDDRRASNDSRERMRVEPDKVATVVQKPGFGQKWREARPTKMVTFWIALAAIALALIVGFNWGGWVSGGTAQKMANTAASSAVVARLAPICVAQFNQDPQKDQKLSEFKAITSSYDRATYLRKQTWAVMPGEKTPNNDVADACAKLLMGS